MKLVAAQIASTAGDIVKNIAKHEQLVERAATHGANGIFFPELSLTGYEPGLAAQLAMAPDDQRLDTFQRLSDRFAMLIAVGAPLRGEHGIEIGMIVFQPGVARSAYAKQQLHVDELPFFSPGAQQRLFSVGGHLLAPAICYESLQPDHAQQAADAGAHIYFASVAKSARGVAAAYNHYPAIARRHAMTVIMANCVGPADNFNGAGQSGVWSADGALVICAPATAEALLVHDVMSGTGELVTL